jgi:dTDP-D-glucose 4,6-dehydratase
MVNLVEKILSLMEKKDELPPNILLQTKIEREIDAQYLSANKISEKFGWSAKIRLDEGLKRTIQWYQEHFAEIV